MKSAPAILVSKTEGISAQKCLSLDDEICTREIMSGGKGSSLAQMRRCQDFATEFEIPKVIW